jgi:hypothetical protein
MVYRLVENVQVRKETWGLLFYSQSHHKACFVKSGDWLNPEHFNGTWTHDGIIKDIAWKTGAPAETIERYLTGLTGRLTAKRIIIDEVC